MASENKDVSTYNYPSPHGKKYTCLNDPFCAALFDITRNKKGMCTCARREDGMDRVFTCLGPGAPNPICMCIDQPEQSKHNTDDKSEGAAGYVPVRPGFVNIQIQCPTNYTICRDEKLEPSRSPGAKDGKIECKCDVPLMHRKIATLDVLGPSPSATFEGLASCTRIGETNTCWYTITADLDGDKKLSEKEWEATFGENCEWSGADVELKTFTVPPFLDSKHKEGDELKNPMPRINYVWVNHPLCPPSTPNTQAKCTNTERIVSYRTCAASKRELTNFPFSCYAMKDLNKQVESKWHPHPNANGTFTDEAAQEMEDSLNANKETGD